MPGEVGPSLILIGVAATALGFLQANLAPLVAVGLSIIAVGLLTWGEGAARERVLLKLGEAGWENVSALILASGIPPKAYYLPSSVAGRPVAVISPARPGQVPRGAFTFKTGGGPALVLSTPGSKALELCGELPGDLGEALRSCVVNVLGFARSVAVAERNGEYVVEYAGVSYPEFYRGQVSGAALGSVLASVTAAVVAEVLNRVVEIAEERVEGRRAVVVLR
ncbi:hypothetical protein [Pyrobaculum aerophilum]|uniref:hypothetical protein n=1 Tax=Pyrobaculum aerophilum TaxID=13773 RepID=UPI0023F5263B|nr:hypothetical protein [Pyrobaculum aerophilum]MCX8137757.1 hypothetical protein [Pyrobaculum aerophilum]